jgi:hypothetical protein
VGGDPINRIDPTGRRGLLLSTLITTAIIGGLFTVPYMRAIYQGAQHTSYAEGGYGGLSIDNHMSLLSADVHSFVSSVSAKTRKELRESFGFRVDPGVVNSWDVMQLYDSGFHAPSSFSAVNAANANPANPDVFAHAGSLAGTVSWSGSVYHADDVNYYFFGLLVRALDDADGIETYGANRRKIILYRGIIAQGDKTVSRLEMFDAGYEGVSPPTSAKVGGPVTASSDEYTGSLTWRVVRSGTKVVERSVGQ